MSLTEFFEYLMAHDASRRLALCLVETYTERSRVVRSERLARSA